MWTGARALYFRHHEVSACLNSYRNYKKMCLIWCTQGPSWLQFWTQEKSNGSTIWRIWPVNTTHFWSNIPWPVHFEPRVYNILHRCKFLWFEVFINRSDLGLSGKVLAAWLNKQMTLWINITIIWEIIKQWKNIKFGTGDFIKIMQPSFCSVYRTVFFAVRLNCLNSTAWVK